VESIAHMEASFSATEEYFFRNSSKCIVIPISKRRRKKEPGKELPKDEIAFEFNSV